MNYVVIKCGGSVFEQLPPSFYQDIVEIQAQGEWQPIIVHGGGPLISRLLEQTGVETTFGITCNHKRSLRCSGNGVKWFNEQRDRTGNCSGEWKGNRC